MADQTFDRAPSRPIAALDRFSPAVLLPLALVFGALAQWLFYGMAPGLNLGLAAAALIALAWRIRPVGARVDSFDRWITPTAVAFALLPALRADLPLLLFDVPATLVLVAMSAVSLAGIPLTRRAVDLLLMLGLVVAGRILAGGAVLLAAMPDLGRPLARRAGGRIGSIGVGLALAFPFLVVFALLFASADAVFSSALRNLFDLERWSIGELVGRILLAGTFAWLAGGLFLVAGRGVETSLPPLLPRLRGLVSSTAATTMLLAVDGLFAVFVVLQVAYLFGGLDTLNATGLAYSEYARRGFFELIAVALIAGVLVFGVELVRGRRTRVYIIAVLVLIAATLAVVASAAYRMQLYQLAYGWTELRFYALAAIVWLGAGAILAALLVWRDAAQLLLHAAALLGLAVAVGANLLGPASFVAQQNIERVVDPSGLPPDAYRGLDARYLVGLGDGAVSVLIDALARLDPASRELLGSSLRTYALEARDLDPAPWQAFNFDRERARTALVAAADELRRYPSLRSSGGSAPRRP